MNNETSVNTINTTGLMTTAAPVAAHKCEVISVIAEELFACLTIGYGYGLAIEHEFDKPAGATCNEALNRADIDWGAYDREQRVSVSPPLAVSHIAQAALESVKSWARDVNAFYNNELLDRMVVGLCDDYFTIGTLARHDTIGAFLIDFNDAMAKAITACGGINRS